MLAGEEIQGLQAAHVSVKAEASKAVAAFKSELVTADAKVSKTEEDAVRLGQEMNAVNEKLACRFSELSTANEEASSDSSLLPVRAGCKASMAFCWSAPRSVDLQHR